MTRFLNENRYSLRSKTLQLDTLHWQPGAYILPDVYHRKCEASYICASRDGVIRGGVEIFTVEMSMHGSFDRLQEHRNQTHRDWNIAIFALPTLVATVLVALAIVQPAVPTWISEAAQAEFVGLISPDAVPAQTAQPALQIRTVKAD